MLDVVSMEEARALIDKRFGCVRTRVETCDGPGACGRALARSVAAAEGVPAFTRSTVDGYALRASDTFGCSDPLPAILRLAGQVHMGQAAPEPCEAGSCWAVPTGGMVPPNADAVVMIEHTETFGDGTIGVSKAAAPGDNLVFQHDDVSPGQTLCPAGSVIAPHHIGAFASIGIEQFEVFAAPKVGVVSTGDEIVPVSEQPSIGQMRDVNGPLLAAAASACKCEPVTYGIVADEQDALLECLQRACRECDLVLVSGGSSVGQRDVTSSAFEQLGEILFHGVAMKPGKPTIAADLHGVPAFGLPGHPLAAYYSFLEFVAPLLKTMQALHLQTHAFRTATLGQAIPSNHGRAELVAVQIDSSQEQTTATPIRSKSGLIGLLAEADGYIVVGRDQEGLPAGASVLVKPFQA